MELVYVYDKNRLNVLLVLSQIKINMLIKLGQTDKQKVLQNP